MNVVVLIAVLAAELPSEGGPAREGLTRPRPLSARSAALLSVAADVRFTVARRAEAVAEVGRRGEKAAVPKLLALLPDEYGLLTMKVIVALHQIGDPRALPVLEGLEQRAEKEGIDIPGKLRSCLQGAIESLRKAR